MRIFTEKELYGQWSSENFRFVLSEEAILHFVDFSDGNIVKVGKYKIYDNFLIFQYQYFKLNLSKTFKIIDLKHNLILMDYSDNVGVKIDFKKSYHDVSLIKQISFEHFEGTIDDLKKELDISVFHFNTAVDKNGNKSNFYRHWENNKRIAVIAKKEIIEELKGNADLCFSAIKTVKIGKLGYYNNIHIFRNDNFEAAYSPFDLTKVYQDYYYNNSQNEYQGFD